MSTKTAVPEPEIRVIALVRDKDGRPKVDDPRSLPQQIIDQLSQEDREWLSL